MGEMRARTTTIVATLLATRLAAATTIPAVAPRPAVVPRQERVATRARALAVEQALGQPAGGGAGGQGGAVAGTGGAGDAAASAGGVIAGAGGALGGGGATASGGADAGSSDAAVPCANATCGPNQYCGIVCELPGCRQAGVFCQNLPARCNGVVSCPCVCIGCRISNGAGRLRLRLKRLIDCHDDRKLRAD
jgi:hypothetical protein